MRADVNEVWNRVVAFNDAHRVPQEQQTKVTVQLTDEPAIGGELAVDSQYVHFAGNKVPLSGGDTSPWFGGYALDAKSAYGARYVGPGSIVASTSKASGDELILARPEGVVHGVLPYRDHVYYLVEASRDDATGATTYELNRAPLVPSDSAALATFTDTPISGGIPFTIGDEGLFWVANHRLVRRVIEDYVDVTPAQGNEGAPCFGDLGCDSGLACVDCTCQQAP